MSAGFIVGYMDGGFFFMHMPQISARILMRDSSVSMTFALTEVRFHRRDCMIGFENGFRLLSSAAAMLKSEH